MSVSATVAGDVARPAHWSGSCEGLNLPPMQMQRYNPLDHQLPAPDRRFPPFLCPASPAGGTLYEVPKDPVISGNAVVGVFACVQPVAAGCSSMTVITL